VVRLGVEALGDLTALLQQAVVRSEDGGGVGVHLVLFQRRVMAETVCGEVLEWLEENGGKSFLVLFLDLENLLGGLKRFVALWVADFCKHQPGGGGGGESNLGRHGGRKLDDGARLGTLKWRKMEALSVGGRRRKQMRTRV
jgi:hypothetical protein